MNHFRLLSFVIAAARRALSNQVVCAFNKWQWKGRWKDPRVKSWLPSVDDTKLLFVHVNWDFVGSKQNILVEFFALRRRKSTLQIPHRETMYLTSYPWNIVLLRNILNGFFFFFFLIIILRREGELILWARSRIWEQNIYAGMYAP